MACSCGPAGVTLLTWLGVWAALPHAGVDPGLVGPVRPLVPSPPPTPPQPPPPPGLPHPADPPTPVIAVRVRVPADAPATKELCYHIVVENCSPAAAHHVIVRNPLPANARFVRSSPEPTRSDPELQWHLGTMHGGERRVIVLVLAPTSEEDVTNCTRVQFEHGQCVVTRRALTGQVPGQLPGQPPLPGEAGREPPASGKDGDKEKPGPGKIEPVPKGEAKIKLEMTGPRQQYLNLPATYYLTLRNTGTAPAANAMISAAVPPKMTFASASGGGKFVANQAAWLLGTLDAGASRTVELVLRAEEEGERCVKAGALADPGLRDEAEVCTTFRGTSAVLLEVVDRQDPVEVDGETSYPIVIVNQGSTPVTNLRLRAFVPPALGLVKATGPSDNRLGERTPEGYQVLLFDVLPALAAGGRAEYEVFVKALRPADARFRVELDADQLKAGGPVREEESTTSFSEANPIRPVPQQSRLRRKE